MSETLTARARKIWDDNWHYVVAGVVLIAWILSATWVFGGPSPRDVAIQEIAALQRTSVAEQHMTNQLLRDLIKAQERK